MSTLVMCKYQKINSGSMRGSAKLWKPVSTQLIEEMIQKLVQIERYYLFSYVNTISSILNTVDPTLLRSTMENWNTYSGSQELTYAGKMRAFVHFIDTLLQINFLPQEVLFKKCSSHDSISYTY